MWLRRRGNLITCGGEGGGSTGASQAATPPRPERPARVFVFGLDGHVSADV